MDTQYRKNLKAVAQACKDYTDNSIEKLKWELGTYDLSAETINGTTMLLPTPANTIQATMVRIDGNSKVSENLIVLNDIAETTNNGITYKIENGVITLNGTATQATTIDFVCNTIDSGIYSICWFNDWTIAWDYFKASLMYNASYVRQFSFSTINASITSISAPNGITKVRIYITGNPTFTNAHFKPMLVKGTTAPTEFKVGFTGIHNLELSGLKVEGQNLFDNANTTLNKELLADGTISDNSNYFYSDYIEVDNNSTYNYNLGVAFNTCFYDSNKTFISGYPYSTTFTTPNNAKYIRMSATKARLDTLMICKGTTIPTTYEPYVSQTLPIDLSTILYNGSPLFEGNSLKAVGTAKDYITPYVAHKGVGSRAYQSGDEEDTSVLTDGTTTLYPLTTPIKADIDFSQLVKFEAYSNGSTTLVNTNNQDTTSTFKYLKEVAK